MASLKQLIVEIHRRSLWQVVTIYAGASWAVMEAVDHVVNRYFLPEWVSAAAVILLLIGLPIVLATAFVREQPLPATGGAVADRDRSRRADEGGEAEGAGASPGADADRDPAGPGPSRAQESGAGPGLTGLARSLRSSPVGRFFTWPRAILGGGLAFLALGAVSAAIVLRGTPRVAEAHGAAGDAFGERAWILVAEFEAPEDAADVAAAARTALTVDLQQSRFLNVYGRERVAGVLRRMGRPDTTRLGRQLALEIAEREGIAAVLAPELSSLGSDYVFSARVVEPGTHRELIAVRTAARADRLLEGVEALSREVRARLGEARDQIRRSKPLPQVTTRSLEALKKYALARTALELHGDNDRAAELAGQAVRLDSTFAMAYRLLSVVLNNQARLAESAEHARRAYELRDRLADRERLHVEAFYHFTVNEDPRKAADTYELLLTQYPDDSRAANNLGVMTGIWLGDYERAYDAYLRAARLDPHSALSHGNAVTAAIGMERWTIADSLIRAGERREFDLRLARTLPALAFGRGRLDRADALCDSLLPAVSAPEVRAEARITCGSIDLARGRPRGGLERMRGATRYYAAERRHWWQNVGTALMLVAEQRRGRPEAAAAALDELLTRAPADSIQEPDRHYVRTHLRIAAGLVGRTDLMDRIEAAYPEAADRSQRRVRYGEALADAARGLAGGDAAAALRRLRGDTEGDFQPFFWRTERELLYAFAFEGVGETDSAIAHLESAIAPGFTGIWFRLESRVHLPSVLRRLAGLEEARGNPAAALRHYRRLLELWSDAEPEFEPRVEAVRRAVNRLAGVESG